MQSLLPLVPHSSATNWARCFLPDAYLQARGHWALICAHRGRERQPQGMALTPLGNLTSEALGIWPQPPLPAHRSCCIGTSLFCLPPRGRVSRRCWMPCAAAQGLVEPQMPSFVPFGFQMLGVALRGCPTHRGLSLSLALWGLAAFLQDSQGHGSPPPTMMTSTHCPGPSAFGC